MFLSLEDVLEVYTRPYDPRFPQICMDESAKQLLREKQESQPMQPGQSERFDYPFESAGMCKRTRASSSSGSIPLLNHESAPRRRTMVQ